MTAYFFKIIRVSEFIFQYDHITYLIYRIVFRVDVDSISVDYSSYTNKTKL